MSKINYQTMGPDGPVNEAKALDRQWWKAPKKELAQSVTAVIKSLEKYDSPRQLQFQVSTKLYGNVSLMGLNGLSYSKISAVQQGTRDRITFNLVQSCVDTLVSKMAKNRPRPLFLTSGGDYKMQRKAKKLDRFCEGVFYENNAYQLGPEIFRDAGIWGTGVVHIFAENGRIKWERIIPSELYFDQIDAFYGTPRQCHRVKAVDRGVLIDLFPSYKKEILEADSASAMLTGTNQNIADMIVVSESWHLPSGPEANDGLHAITVGETTLFVEKYEKPCFPFVFLHWNKRLYGVWGQGIAEQVQSIQLEINKILWVIQRSMHLYGTFRVWMKTGSKVPKEHINNEIGAIIVGDEKPEYLSSGFIPQEYFTHLQTLKAQGFEQVGISQLSAASKKPSGLDSGRALREFNDIESERFMVAGQAYQQFFLDLARLSISVAKDIYQDDKSYKVKVPGKKFVETIDWADIDLEEDEYYMKMFPVSSLPNDPAGRLETIREYMSAGMLSPRQGRRLLDFPDLEQMESLVNAQEDYLHEVLEKIVDEGEYTPPEPLDDLTMARELALEYYSQGKCLGLEEERLEMLRRFLDQIGILESKITPPQGAAPAPGGPAPAGGIPGPQAVPTPPPVSPYLPNVPQG